MLRRIILMFFCLIFSIFSESKLVFYCSFDNEDAKDLIGGQIGEIKGGKFVEGKIGKGIYFGGKEKEAECVIFKELAKDRFFQDFEGGPFTISVWIKPDSIEKHNRPYEILNTASDIGPGWRLTYAWRMIIFRTGTGKRDAEGKGEYWEVKTEHTAIDRVMPDTWNHIVVVRNEEGILSLYLNGKKVAESEKKFDIIPSNRFLTIGAYIGGYACGFKGVIDEIKIYKGALSPDEILKEYMVENMKINPDGKLDEDIWKRAVSFKNFYKISTDILSPVQTEVLFNYDKDNFYFAFICDEPSIEKIKNNVRENSLNVYGDDCVEIMIDANNDKEGFYHFLFNPSGYYGVEFRTRGGAGRIQVPEFLLYTGSFIGKNYWIVEVVIPYYSLFYERPSKTISLNFARNRRIDYVGLKEESCIVKNGEFLNARQFLEFNLENIDFNFYYVNISLPFVKRTYAKDDKIESEIEFEVENNTDREREISISINDKNLGCIDKKIFILGKREKRNINFQMNFPGSGNYSYQLIGEEKGKKIFIGPCLLRINYIPLEIELVKPFYRNSIYPSQKINEIILNVSIKEKMDLKKMRGKVTIIGLDGKIFTQKEIDSLKENMELSLPVENLKYGKYRISCEIDKDNKIILSNSILIEKLPPPEKGNEVYIDENLNLVLNGKPILPILWYTGSPFDEVIKKIAETGADGSVVGWVTSTEALDKLWQIGQYACWILLSGNEEEKYLVNKDSLSKEAIELIRKRVNLIKGHPSLLYYYIGGESEDKGVSPKILKEVYELLKELDPYHPVTTGPNWIETGLYPYIDCADMFQPDLAVVPKTDGTFQAYPITFLADFMDAIRYKGKNKKFAGIVLEAYNLDKLYKKIRANYTPGTCRGPTFVEERAFSYLTIVHGAKGFIYYVYGNLNDPEHWGAVNIPDLRVGVPYLIKEKKSLSDVILLGKEVKERVNIEDKRVHYQVKELNGKIYIIAVNVEPEEIKVEIKVPENIKRLKVISEKREIEVKGGIFSDRFMPYEVHIYTDDLKFQDVIDLKKVEEEIKKEGGWYTYKYKK